MDAIDDELFDDVINGLYVSTKLAPTPEDPNKVTVKQRLEWTKNEKKLVTLDKRAKNIMFITLEDDLFENMVNCKTAKEM